MFYSQIVTLKLNIRPNIGLPYAFFSALLSRKIFLLFFPEFELLMFHINIVNISEELNKRDLLKICPQFSYPTFIFIVGKSENISCFKNQLSDLNFLCIGSYDK